MKMRRVSFRKQLQVRGLKYVIRGPQVVHARSKSRFTELRKLSHGQVSSLSRDMTVEFYFIFSNLLASCLLILAPESGFSRLILLCLFPLCVLYDYPIASCHLNTSALQDADHNEVSFCNPLHFLLYLSQTLK